jgi:hypothetical protein
MLPERVDYMHLVRRQRANLAHTSGSSSASYYWAMRHSLASDRSTRDFSINTTANAVNNLAVEDYNEVVAKETPQF